MFRGACLCDVGGCCLCVFFCSLCVFVLWFCLVFFFVVVVVSLCAQLEFDSCNRAIQTRFVTDEFERFHQNKNPFAFGEVGCNCGRRAVVENKSKHPAKHTKSV